MAGGSYLKSAGLAALAAGIALFGAPLAAQAQADSVAQAKVQMAQAEGGWRGGQGRGGGNWRGEAARENAPSAAPAQVPQQRAWNGENRGGWRGRGGDAVAAPIPAPQAPPPVVQAPQTQGNPGWRGRSGWNGGERRDWRGTPQQQGGAVTQNWRDRNDGDRRGTWSRDGRREDASRWNQNNTRTRDGWNGDNRRYEANRWSGDNRQWSRDWRRNDRYNWQSYRTSHRDIFRAGRYYSPYRNHYYSRLSIGFYLDSLFYSNNYWINDPWQYRLPDVYGPYRWVRYYDDAVLVDVYSGEVVDVIYDFFW